MRELLRSMAKAEMARQGYSKVNRRMRNNRWRQILKIAPRDRETGLKINSNFHGNKRQRKGSKQPILMY